MNSHIRRIALPLPLVITLALAGLAPRVAAAPSAVTAVGEPQLPPGCEPDEVRRRLAAIDSADVAKACGAVAYPWADRGLSGRGRALRAVVRTRADSAWAARVASYLLRDAVIDTAYSVPPVEIGCDTVARVPIYVVRMMHGSESTIIVLRFDIGAGLVFDREHPLGAIRMGASGDSLWAALGDVLEGDPLLPKPRPVPVPSVDTSRAVAVDVTGVELPQPTQRMTVDYPEAARRANIEGVVYLRVLVAVDGTVHDAYVVAGPPDLRDTALSAVWEWRFRPARRKHKPFAAWVAVPVTFKLR